MLWKFLFIYLFIFFALGLPPPPKKKYLNFAGIFFLHWDSKKGSYTKSGVSSCKVVPPSSPNPPNFVQIFTI
jgi:hypothetical protein